ncbi:UDP-N-acetylglucosamine--N-acetylmuramyl-(pentapeptide) pyrophosphoryl-undecaprenol N-acetylglucosamine transferase [Botrimarina hoheduenensis]|uniref:UDP-N-acetylglucosamine--N-acetylmuramyl-(pentapeptide) pyrophosphoryl-undecaprenol N-acetylglucosamine transferase n=1 Tax=Botrimarina hoheduenensis TaxID=2528000 RepID=A0A5C5WF75_9BACT|nr:UDP-N-acetylglucosamine--N-acetylmuramyl-(pentapeptide) pyrophosphoryl-undecaprenol N-acetylglucosamine transferase [Botrimarina hoheduenensis]TWT48723.1 UDP-N-acetylglucosamine--N-acetylmuramyl-(pentapeptide) pyrophosphoryl-undecaprenol N-acetylglucosamine transferase MurG [Botrimarina hoheduenensis]
MHCGHHILFAGGGSLGYLYPGLSIAAEIEARLPGVHISFAGDGRPIERHTIRSAGYAYSAIPCCPKPRSAWESLRFVTDNALGFFASRWMLKEQGVTLVVGLGGHASAPVMRAAHGWGLPMVMLEQNAIPSLAARWLAGVSDAVCLGFEEARAHLPVQAPVRVTGVPVRPSFQAFGERPSRCVADADPLRQRRLVVLGGSGGARTLNEAMPIAAARLAGELGNWRIIHQTGEGQLVETERRYQEAGIDALVVTYIDELADLLRETDLVVCPAGGCTMAEIALSGTAMLVIPDTLSRHGSQIANAKVYERLQACRIIDETRGTLSDTIAAELGPLTTQPATLARMAEAAATLVRHDAARSVAEACMETLGLATAPKGAASRRAAAA